MCKIFFSILLSLVFCFSAEAQDNWNRLLADPFADASDSLDYTLRIAPVNVMADLSSSYIIKDITDQNDTTRLLNWENLLAQTKDKNGAFGQYAFNILQTEFRVKGLVMNAGFGTRSEAYGEMDGPSVRFILGNTGGIIDAASSLEPNIHYNSWYQLNVGAKKYFNQSFIGLNAKLVDGIEHFKLNASYTVLANDIFNELQVTRNVTLQSTSLLRYNSINDIEFQPNGPFSDNIGFDNIGLLFDIYGGTRVDRHLFNVSISVIGFINWSQGGRTNEYTSDGEVTYEGIDISDALSSEFEFNLQDTLENIVGLQLTDTESYNSNLLTKINVRYQFDYREDLHFGINNFFAIDGTYGYFRINLFANKKLTDWWDVGVSYSFDRYSAFNVGLNTHVEFKNIRIGLSTQNFLSLFDPYAYNVSNVNIRTEYIF